MEKNCGNCGHVCYGIFDVVCPYPRYEGQEPYECGHYRQCTLEKPCDRHTYRQGTLEQRYEQIEQVAKSMYEAIKRDADESWSPAKEKVAANFNDKLKALGVDV